MDMFIVLREPGEARTSNWQNIVKSWYDSEDEARTEAERLCSSTGKRFVVLKAIAYVEPVAAPVQWHDGGYDPLSDLPF
jgi:hypothetical protein